MSPEYRALVQQLASPVAQARDAARAELVAGGRAAVPALVDALGSDDRNLRAGAALCLGQMRFLPAAPVLAAMARQDPDPSVRPLALRALADLAGPDAPEVVRQTLLDRLSSADMFDRALACQGLGRIGDPECRRALHGALGDAERWVHEAARRALAQRPPEMEHGAPPAAAPASTALVHRATAELDRLLADLASPDLPRQSAAKLALLALDPTDDVVARLTTIGRNDLSPGRHAAVEVLGGIGGPGAMQALADLLADPLARPLAPTILHGMARVLERTEAVPVLDAFPAPEVRSSLEDTDPLVRAASVAALVAAGGLDRRAALARAATDPEAWVHLAACGTLARMAGPEDADLLPTIVAWLTAADNDVRRQLDLLVAIERILAGSPPPASQRPAVMSAASYCLLSESPDVRAAAGEIVALAGSPGEMDAPTLTAFLDLLDPEDRPPRPDLIRAIGRLAPKSAEEAIERLRRVLQHHARTEGGRATAQEAAKALATLGSRPAIAVLVEAANSRGGAVVAIAAQTLASMDPRAEVVATRGPDGTWEVRVQRFCPCGGDLTWVRRDREELRCPRCDKEFIVALGGQLCEADRTPFGTCLCRPCRRRQALVRKPASETLYCPVSGEVHVRPFDHPEQLRLLGDLPIGACSCCAEPQPLIRLNEAVVCYRTHERYRPTATGFVLETQPRGPTVDDVAAINQALLAGSIAIGQSGLATVGQLELASDEDDEGG